MKTLILGGTLFLGRAVVEAAQAAGHEVTLFNRGKTNPHLFPGLERLQGDRREDLSALHGRRWDLVVDTSGYVPREVRMSAELLASQIERYIFISTLSVYAHLNTPGVEEDAPLASIEDESTDEVTGETYGPLKALCERTLLELLPAQALLLRPGLIVGPYDPTDRFTYWVLRVARGGEILVPGPPDRPIQFIDARDLAEWILRLADDGTTGVFNAIGPAERLTMRQFLGICQQAGQSETSFIWVEESFLLEQGVEPWSQMPLWIPTTDSNLRYIFQVSNTKAGSKGLAFRPVAETVKDTLAWASERGDLRSGISLQREKKLLEVWKRGKDARRTR
jgi:2'-hydroxyisoflavone reductase